MIFEHHVKMMELTISHENYFYDRIALFDDRDITEDEIIECVKENEDIMYDDFALLTKKQYANIFRSLKGE